MNEEMIRIRREYNQRDHYNLSSAYRYSNPAFLFHMQERERLILDLMASWQVDLSGASILEVGCGTGHILHRFGEFGAENIHGIDLMEKRLRIGKQRYPRLCLVEGNAAQLPYADGTFDIVMQFMCLSSVLDPTMRNEITNEMLRVLRPGGVILHYDLRPPPMLVRGFSAILRLIGSAMMTFHLVPLITSRPLIPPTPIQPLGDQEIRMLFGCGPMKCRTASLNFKLAQTAGQSYLLTTLLSCIPFLRTHYLALIRKVGECGKGKT